MRDERNFSMRVHALVCLVLATGTGVIVTACGEDAPIAPLTIARHTTTTAPMASPSTVPSPSATPSGSFQGAQATQPPPPPPTAPPVPLECSPPSPDPSGTPQGSNLGFSGVCTFTETAKVSCSTQPDDFLFQFKRATPNGPTIYYNVNVEYYKGPGTYTQYVQMIFEIPDNGTIYEWDNQNGSATIDQSGSSGSINNVDLPADPGTPSQGTEYVNGSFQCV